jgi:hypothetical protein
VFAEPSEGDPALSEHSPSSSLDLLDRVLGDASTPTGMRRWLLRRAAVGAAGVAAASAGILASSALADDRPHGPSNGDGSIDDWGVFTSTTEALTVTILDELLRRTSLHPEVPSDVSVTFDAVYAAELDHWNFISQHFDPSTKHFWIPDGFFGGADDALDLTAVGKGVSGGETLFVNTYLVGVTTFAEAGDPKFARYAAEAAGDESEHRVLGQTLAGASPPNNLGFEEFVFDNVGDIEAALVGAGFGLGQEGTSPGRFYDFPDPPMAPPIPISSNEPK